MSALVQKKHGTHWNGELQLKMFIPKCDKNSLSSFKVIVSEKIIDIANSKHTRPVFQGKTSVFRDIFSAINKAVELITAGGPRSLFGTAT